MINYKNEEIKFTGCPGCAYGKHEFELPCGMAFENDKFTLSQDWELPIPGFFVVSPKRHIEKLSELTKEERIEMFEIVNKTTEILRKNHICERFDYVFEEKENRHLHVWIMPRYYWMNDINKDIIGHIEDIFQYAKKELRNDKTYKKIKKISNVVKNNF